ncbi:MAG: hypothetical protein VX871_02215 [Pseudomonadota bacterium]|nr:hypothetical protein [Pseudomonadota bacterium]
MTSTGYMARGLCAAALMAFWAAPAQANCEWSIGMLRQDIALIESIAPIAANAGKDVQAKYQTALDGAKSAVARAELLAAKRDYGACEYAVGEARDRISEARDTIPKPKNG